MLDLDRSVKFYEEQFGLTKYRDITSFDGKMRLAFLRDDTTSFRMELTQYVGRTKPFDKGENEFHLAFYTDDYDRVYQKHKEANMALNAVPELKLHFIQDPDGNMVEILAKPEE